MLHKSHTSITSWTDTHTHTKGFVKRRLIIMAGAGRSHVQQLHLRGDVRSHSQTLLIAPCDGAVRQQV